MVKLIFFIFPILVFSQQNIERLNIDCGVYNTIEKGNHIVIDTLSFNTKSLFLIQDNATLKIKKVIGTGQILRGGIGGAPTVNGIDRYPEDASPTVTLIGCPEDFNSLEIGENIDVVFVFDNCN